ncbi:hypothetical protein [Armatimonas sp.]|uniref:hypothetical protein n=1 Tax=Armatimonas sp. TaxID=1872638 RepID=UPI0037534E3C
MILKNKKNNSLSREQFLLSGVAVLLNGCSGVSLPGDKFSLVDGTRLLRDKNYIKYSVLETWRYADGRKEKFNRDMDVQYTVEDKLILKKYTQQTFLEKNEMIDTLYQNEDGDVFLVSRQFGPLRSREDRRFFAPLNQGVEILPGKWSIGYRGVYSLKVHDSEVQEGIHDFTVTGSESVDTRLGRFDCWLSEGTSGIYSDYQYPEMKTKYWYAPQLSSFVRMTQKGSWWQDPGNVYIEVETILLDTNMI